VQLVEKARSDLETSQRDSEIAVTEAFLGVASGIAQIAALEQAVKSNEITLKGMEIGQRNGFRTNTDVLDAQQQLYAVKRDLQRERYQYLLNWLKLKAAVGSLGWADLQAVDAMVAIGH
jgi:outer membrane protein